MPDRLRLDEALAQWLSAGEITLAQVRIRVLDDGGYELRHIKDRETPVDKLQSHTDWKAARDLSWMSDDNEYRPLKGASNLRTGWRLILASVEAVRLALDSFYPAAVGLWQTYQEGELRVLSFRETLERQTGMYRYAREISEAGAESVVRDRCEAECLRHRLWTISSQDGAKPNPDKAQIPFLCPEACNILVADARKVSKAEAGK